jgi:cation diffusion facilitator CzcD-associated flavoprotein CzcO
LITAGVSGIAAAIKLKEAGLNVKIIERDRRFGGTWSRNTYPGSGCDIFCYLYSYSFAPKAFSRQWAKQPELLAYFDEVARAHKLQECTMFETVATELTWDEESNLWRTKIRRSTTGEEGVLISNFVIACVGLLSEALMPNIAGLNTFAGPVFHASEWRHDVDLRGRTVACVGAAASAIQFVPEIAPLCKKLIVFQSTPSHVVPKDDFEMPPWAMWMLLHVPFAAKLYRLALYLYCETFYLIIGCYWPIRDLLMSLYVNRALEHARKGLSRDMLARVVPQYALGGTRVLASSDWYATLQRPNVELVTHRVTAARADAVRDSAGAWHACDVVICATGFHASKVLKSLRVTGRDGQSLHDDEWCAPSLLPHPPRGECLGRIGAHLGIDVPRFPNLFMTCKSTVTGVPYKFAETQTVRTRIWRIIRSSS